ncbi:MAG: molybdate ABC transporter substrate-binding protein [Bacteroidota bacterium]
MADGVRAVVRDDAVVGLGATSTLARQIAQGAPADVFASADPEWVDWLRGEGVLVLSERVVAHGSLVVVGPADMPAGALGDPLVNADRIAVADPAHVPAGQYAEAALRSTGRWEQVSRRVLPCADVRAALAAVESGAADAGIVYASDVGQSDRVVILDSLTAGARRPTFVVAALSERGRTVVDRIAADTASWRSAGFDPVAP